MIIIENSLWCARSAKLFIRIKHAAHAHQRPLKQQQYCLTKPK